MPNMYREKLKDTPKEYLNWRLYFAVFIFGLMGAARGLDEGMIGTTIKQPSFIHEFGLDSFPSTPEGNSAHANRLSNITSMVQLGSIGGAALAFYLSDKLGRLWATRQLCAWWIVGTIIYLTSAGNLGQLYAGRLIMGIGIGQSTVVAPTYLAEMAPKAIRGLCTTIFAGNVYFGIMLGYFASYGTNLHISGQSARQWIIPNSMHVMFAGIILIASLFSLESPRWLMKVGRDEDAITVMSTLRGMPADSENVLTEIGDIRLQLEHELESVRGSSRWGLVKELLTIRANLYRIYIGILCQILGQWSGANSITVYAPEYFAAVGVQGTTVGLLTTAIFGVVKFVAALSCAFFLVDFIGRKRSLGIGIGLQFIAMLYIALFMFIDPGVAKTPQTPQSASDTSAGIGAIVFIYISGIGWALGWNTIQYLINAEIFPLRLRSIGTSVVMVLHFANQYGNTKAVPSMFLALGYGGTMLFFAVVTLIGFFWVIFSIPELAGKSLEAVDEVFELPWWSIGLRGGKVGNKGPVDRALEHGNEDEKEKVVELVEHYQRRQE